MKTKIIKSITNRISSELGIKNTTQLERILNEELKNIELDTKKTDSEISVTENKKLLNAFLSAKKIEGCSEKTINYYKSSLQALFDNIKKELPI